MMSMIVFTIRNNEMEIFNNNFYVEESEINMNNVKILKKISPFREYDKFDIFMLNDISDLLYKHFSLTTNAGVPTGLEDFIYWIKDKKEKQLGVYAVLNKVCLN